MVILGNNYTDILNDIGSLKESIMDGRGTVCSWNDMSEAIRERIGRQGDCGKETEFNMYIKLERVVEMVREEQGTKHKL